MPTTNYGWDKPTVAGDNNAWGTKLNTLFDDADADLKAVQDIADAALPKAGGTMTGDIDCDGNEIQNAVLVGASITKLSIGSPNNVSVAGGGFTPLSATVDLSLGDVFNLGTLPSLTGGTGSLTITFSNRPAAGVVRLVRLYAKGNTAITPVAASGQTAWAIKPAAGGAWGSPDLSFVEFLIIGG